MLLYRCLISIASQLITEYSDQKTNPKPSTRLLLCSINFYRHDIPHCGHITADLQVRLLNWTDTALRNISMTTKSFDNGSDSRIPGLLDRILFTYRGDRIFKSSWRAARAYKNLSSTWRFLRQTGNKPQNRKAMVSHPTEPNYYSSN